MPLYIKDNKTADLVAELARRLKTTKRDAVKSAVKAELDRLASTPSFQEKLTAFYARHPVPPATGEEADKAFFDELSGQGNELRLTRSGIPSIFVIPDERSEDPEPVCVPFPDRSKRPGSGFGFAVPE